MYFPPSASAIIPDADVSSVAEKDEGGTKPTKGRPLSTIIQSAPNRSATTASAYSHRVSQFHVRAGGSVSSFDRLERRTPADLIMKINETDLNADTLMANDQASELEGIATGQESSILPVAPTHPRMSPSASLPVEEQNDDALLQLGVDVAGWERVGPINLLNFICSNVPKLGKDNPISPSNMFIGYFHAFWNYFWDVYIYYFNATLLCRLKT